MTFGVIGVSLVMVCDGLDDASRACKTRARKRLRKPIVNVP